MLEKSMAAFNLIVQATEHMGKADGRNFETGLHIYRTAKGMLRNSEKQLRDLLWEADAKIQRFGPPNSMLPKDVFNLLKMASIVEKQTEKPIFVAMKSNQPEELKVEEKEFPAEMDTQQEAVPDDDSTPSAPLPKDSKRHYIISKRPQLAHAAKPISGHTTYKVYIGQGLNSFTLYVPISREAAFLDRMGAFNNDRYPSIWIETKNGVRYFAE
jgi:hypothetical protein